MPHACSALAGSGFCPCRTAALSPARPPIAPEEADATIAALQPPKRVRPLIALIGINAATETTDYLMPYGICGVPTSLR